MLTASSEEDGLVLQGLPMILAGRDMIGVAFTGSGKTLVFSLPLLMLSVQEEVRMPLERGKVPDWCIFPFGSHYHCAHHCNSHVSILRGATFHMCQGYKAFEGTV
jgi:hypothetical protein